MEVSSTQDRVARIRRISGEFRAADQGPLDTDNRADHVTIGTRVGSLELGQFRSPGCPVAPRAMGSVPTRRLQAEGSELSGRAVFQEETLTYLNVMDHSRHETCHVEKRGDVTLYGFKQWNSDVWELASESNGTLTVLDPAPRFPD
ncbi:MAG: hypothetical protein AB1758_10650 [Candidatus Eremiobacterota bacterium]